MNVHHLELFYYVALHKGIGLASRSMPYGVQRATVSKQLIQLEETLGTKLFIRSPFSLTPSGSDLLRFITPFFSNLSEMTLRLQGEGIHHLRLATSSTILRDHIHDILHKMREEFPKLKLTLKEVNQPTAESLLNTEEIDLTVSMLDDKIPRSVKSKTLIQIPMTLLITRNSKFKTAREILDKTASLPLITLPSHSSFTKLFQQQLKQKNIHWLPRIEVDSLDLVRSYVAKGFGIGLSVLGCNTDHFPSIHQLPLPGFSQVKIAAFWKGPLPPLAVHFLSLVQIRAETLNKKLKASGI